MGERQVCPYLEPYQLATVFPSFLRIVPHIHCTNSPLGFFQSTGLLLKMFFFFFNMERMELVSIRSNQKSSRETEYSWLTGLAGDLLN